MVVVDLALATICFLGSCHPALVGDETPTGAFVLARQATEARGYGGELMAFHEDATAVWAVHRVVEARPDERRRERLAAADPARRQRVTRGCINVTPEVYRRLAACCDGEVLVIHAGTVRARGSRDYSAATREGTAAKRSASSP